jgi:hypothetical protein
MLAVSPSQMAALLSMVTAESATSDQSRGIPACPCEPSRDVLVLTGSGIAPVYWGDSPQYFRVHNVGPAVVTLFRQYTTDPAADGEPLDLPSGSTILVQSRANKILAVGLAVPAEQPAAVWYQRLGSTLK